MKLLYFQLFCVFLTLIFNSCNANFLCDCLEGAGSTARVEHAFKNETSLNINSAFDVYLINDSVNKIIVEGGDNLLKNVRITTDSTAISISNTNVCDWARKYENIKLYIHTKTLTSFNNESPSKIVSSNTLTGETLNFFNNTPLCSVNVKVDCTTLRFDMWNGSGDFTIKGRCSTFVSYCLGSGSSGFLWADSLKTNTCQITTNSTGDYHLNVDTYLGVGILWIGNVYYRGNPTIKIDTLASTGRPIKE